jgi:hypothetical protein
MGLVRRVAACVICVCVCLCVYVQVFGLIILIELFGSPFMRSAAIVFALVIGTAVAAIATVDGKRLFNGNAIRNAPVITFLWVKTFPLGEGWADSATPLCQPPYGMHLLSLVPLCMQRFASLVQEVQARRGSQGIDCSSAWHSIAQG